MTTVLEVNLAALVAIALAAILLAATLSAGESAVLSVSRHKIWARTTTGDGRGAKIRELVERRGATASASGLIRIGLEVASTVALTLVFAKIFEHWWLTLVVSSLVNALVSIVLVRSIPRPLGRSKSESVLFATWRLLRASVLVTGWSTRLTPDLSGFEADSTQAELQDMVDGIDDDIIIEDEDREMIRSVFELGGTITREVMVPRINMVTTRPETTLRKAMTLFLRSGYSRIPVTDKDVDDIVGVVYFKDVSRALHAAMHQTGEDLAAERPVREVMREAIFVPESKPVDELLRYLQEARSHLALVLDEYGGIAGLVTIEDAVEEIVGELTDEHDRRVYAPEELSPGIYRVPAALSVDEVGELFDIQIDDDEVDSVGGALAKALGSVPLAGEEADYFGLHLVAESVQGRRKQLATVLASRADFVTSPDAAAPTTDADRLNAAATEPQPEEGETP